MASQARMDSFFGTGLVKTIVFFDRPLKKNGGQQNLYIKIAPRFFSGDSGQKEWRASWQRQGRPTETLIFWHGRCTTLRPPVFATRKPTLAHGRAQRIGRSRLNYFISPAGYKN